MYVRTQQVTQSGVGGARVIMYGSGVCDRGLAKSFFTSTSDYVEFKNFPLRNRCFLKSCGVFHSVGFEIFSLPVTARVPPFTDDGENVNANTDCFVFTRNLNDIPIRKIRCTRPTSFRISWSP